MDPGLQCYISMERCPVCLLLQHLLRPLQLQERCCIWLCGSSKPCKGPSSHPKRGPWPCWFLWGTLVNPQASLEHHRTNQRSILRTHLYTGSSQDGGQCMAPCPRGGVKTDLVDCISGRSNYLKTVLSCNRGLSNPMSMVDFFPLYKKPTRIHFWGK